MSSFTPGGRFEEMVREQEVWDRAGEGGGFPGIWTHLGWKRTAIDPGFVEVRWEPTSDHSFKAGEGWIVHGGMVTAILDTAMGGATWTLLETNEVFLTADLRTEFYRPTLPGSVRAEGRVVHKTRRVTFAEAKLFDSNDRLLASGRATNISIDTRNPEDRSRSGPADPSRG